MLAKCIGVDLGTANVLVYVKGRGIVINEPSIVAVALRDNSIVAVGREAREMEGRTPEAIQVIRPMRHGVIADYLTTEAMLRYFIGKAVGRFSFVKPEVVICAPAGATGVERRAVQEACEAAGARRPANVIPEPLAAALGARVPIDEARGHMIVDIGGGRTEAAVISLYGIVASESVRVAGDRFDEAIANYVKRRYNLIIGDRTAEEIKIAIGTALPLEEDISYQVRGRDLITALPKTITITANEVHQALQDSLQAVVGAVRAVLERTPPELASDIVDRGIVLVGGGALLRHMDRLLTREIGVPCYVADNPLECVALGAGIALDHLDLIRRAMPPQEEWAVAL
jgi:rod shape-determining protein MreB